MRPASRFGLLTIAALMAVASTLFATIAHAEPIRIVALGHSAFAYQGGPSKDDYPALLEAALRAKGHDVTVANAGVWGDTTTGVLQRLDKAVPNGTQIVVLHIGNNDSNQGRPQAEWQRNTDVIVARVRAKGAKVIQFREWPPTPPLKYSDEGGTVPLVEVLPDRIVIPNIRRNIPPEVTSMNGHLMAAGNRMVVDRTLAVVEKVMADIKQGR